MAQTTRDILMVRPASFGYNPQTAGSNPFQQVMLTDPDEIREIAVREFDSMVELLRSKGIRVHIFQDTPEVPRTDAVFPNNWISTHSDAHVILYSMFSPNRREERRMEVVQQLEQDFRVDVISDLSGHEQHEEYLEGTGSMVFDRVNRISYACLSPRTTGDLFKKTCGMIRYEPVLFSAVDKEGIEIYHTNVLMSLGEKVAVVCLDAIKDASQREMVRKKLEITGHEIVEIDLDQLAAFAGNMLELDSPAGRLLVMSESAHKSLRQEQLKALEKHDELLPIPVETIETTAGGSVRCMIAEIFLPSRSE